MGKTVNPYDRLKAVLRAFADAVEYRSTKSMFFFPKDKLRTGWSLDDVYERVAAADQLGWDVILQSTERGLEVKYRERAPKRPWEAQP